MWDFSQVWGVFLDSSDRLGQLYLYGSAIENVVLVPRTESAMNAKVIATSVSRRDMI